MNAGRSLLGEIREENLTQIKAVGEWIKKNSEAIYGTHTWKIYGEEGENVSKAVEVKTIKGFEDEVYDATEGLKSDIRFTCKDKDVYVIARNWYDKKVVVKSIAKNKIGIKSITLFETSEKTEWNQTPTQLEIKLPLNAKDSLHTYT